MEHWNGESAGTTQVEAGTTLSTNAASALCYTMGLVSGILFLVLAPYSGDRIVRFHAFQAIVFHLAWVVFWMGCMIVTILLPLGLHLLASLMALTVGLGGFLLWLLLMWKAYRGEMLILPILGDLARKKADTTA